MLRALDEETAEHEKQFIADRALIRSIRQTIGNEETVVISDSEDEPDNEQDSEGGRRDGTPHTSGSDKGSNDEVVEVEYRGLGAYTSGNANLGPSMAEAEEVDDRMDEDNTNDADEDQEMDEDGEGGDQLEGDQNMASQLQQFIRDDHTPEDYQLLMDSDQLDPAAYQLMVESGQLQYNQPSNTNEAAQMLLDFSNDQQQVQASGVNNTLTNSTTPAQGFVQTTPVFVVAEQLQPAQLQPLDFSEWYNCASAHCQRQMVLKPWTRFNAVTVEPLCTECTRVWLRDPVLNTDPGALDHLKKQALVHWNEKARRQEQGTAQNMADDAPFDHPAAMHGPVAFARHVNVSTDMPVEDGNRDAMSPLASESDLVNNNDIMSQFVNNSHNEDLTFSSSRANTSNNLNEDLMSQPAHSTNNPADLDAEIFTNRTLFEPPTTLPLAAKSPKQSTWSTMFSGIKNAFTRSPPKSKSSNEGRSGLQSPAYTITANPTANDPRRTTSSNSGNSDFDTNIDDLIDEDSFAADPNRVGRLQRQLVEVADDDEEDGSEGGYYEEEENEEGKRERDEAEYHAAMVEKVKVYDDQGGSDGEYLDD